MITVKEPSCQQPYGQMYVPQHSSFHDIVSESQLLFQVEKLTFAEAEQLLIEGVHDVLESRRTDHCLGPI